MAVAGPPQILILTVALAAQLAYEHNIPGIAGVTIRSMSPTLTSTALPVPIRAYKDIESIMPQYQHQYIASATQGITHANSLAGTPTSNTNADSPKHAQAHSNARINLLDVVGNDTGVSQQVACQPVTMMAPTTVPETMQTLDMEPMLALTEYGSLPGPLPDIPPIAPRRGWSTTPVPIVTSRMMPAQAVKKLHSTRGK